LLGTPRSAAEHWRSAHARSGYAVTIGAYLGSGDALDKALADFAELYADQNELDYAALNAAVKTGRVNAEKGLLRGPAACRPSPEEDQSSGQSRRSRRSSGATAIS